MAIGDDALAAGMALTAGTVAANTIDTEINQTRDYIAQRTSTVTPVTKGGTGSTNAAGARTALGITPGNIGAPATAVGGLEFTTPGFNRLSFNAPGVTGGTEIALMYHVDAKVSKAGDTMTGDLYLASASAVTTSYAAMYRNGDGRVGLTPSALKYKKDIEDYDGSALGLRPVTYVLKEDERQEVRLGVIADEANEIEPFLVIHENGEVESFKYELLAVALLKDVQRLAAQNEALVARIEALEADRG